MLLLLGVFALALGLSLLWLRSESGRGFVARRVEAAVTKQIRGRLRIGAITRLAWAGVSARDVRFTAPEGGDVIVVDEVDMAIRWGALLRGRLVSPWAAARGGRVVLRDGRGGDLTIESAMSDRNPAPRDARPAGAKAAEGGEATVDLQRINVSDVTLVATVSGVPDARVTRIRGALRITVRPPDGDLLLTLDDLAGSGRLDTPLPISLRLTGGTFRFDSAGAERVRADARAVLGDNRVRIRCTARPRGEAMRVAVRLALPSSAGPFDSLPAIAQATALDLTSSNFDFTVSRD
jgi:hypothetical protein